MDVKFEHNAHPNNSAMKLTLIVPSEMVTATINDDHELVITINGDRESKDFLHSCSYIWQDFLSNE